MPTDRRLGYVSLAAIMALLFTFGLLALFVVTQDRQDSRINKQICVLALGIDSVARLAATSYSLENRARFLRGVHNTIAVSIDLPCDTTR